MDPLNPENRSFQDLANRQYKLLLSMGWSAEESRRSTSEMILRMDARDKEARRLQKATVFTNLTPIMAQIVDLLRKAGVDKGMRIEIAPKGGVFTVSRGPEARAAREADPPKPLPTRDWRASLVDPAKTKRRKSPESKARDMGLRFIDPK